MKCNPSARNGRCLRQQNCQCNWDRHATIKLPIRKCTRHRARRSAARVSGACSINISLISITSTSSDSQSREGSRRQSDGLLLHYFPILTAIIIIGSPRVCSAFFMQLFFLLCSLKGCSRASRFNETHFMQLLINYYAIWVVCRAERGSNKRQLFIGSGVCKCHEKVCNCRFSSLPPISGMIIFVSCLKRTRPATSDNNDIGKIEKLH